MGAQIQHFGIVCCTMDFRERRGATLSEYDNEMRKAIVDARESEKRRFYCSTFMQLFVYLN